MNYLKGIRLILLDLDGTLVDTVPDLALATDKMMQDLGRKPYGEDKIREWIGNGAPRLVKRALTNTMNEEPDDELYARAYPIFEHYYAEHVCDRSRLYPGVLEGLDGLENKGFRLGCVTNKPEQYTLPLLQKLEIKHRFELILSGDSLPKKKPDPMPLLYAADHFDFPPEHCLLVGDSVNDVKAARAANFRVVCVPYGYNHGEDIRLSEPDGVINSLADLVSMAG